MKALLEVARRELAERRLALAAAALGGLVPLAVPLLPALGRHDPEAVRDLAAALLVLVAACVVGPLLGAALASRELAEGRLGFYFARPLGAATIWLGKVTGMVALLWAVLLLLLLPATLAGGGLSHLGSPSRVPMMEGWPLGPAETVFAALAATVLLLLAGHVAGVALRSRSAWLLLDLALVPAALWALWAITQRLTRAWTWDALVVAWETLLPALIVALLLAGAVATARGRSDLVRTHRWLSLTLWAGVAVLLAAFGGWAGWVLSPEPGDLLAVEGVTVAPAGGWLSVRGPVRGRPGHEAVFVLEPDDGRWVRASGRGRVALLAFSLDGSRVVWAEVPSQDPLRGELILLDLATADPTPVATGQWLRVSGASLAFSPDGDRLAVIEGGRLSLMTVDGGRLLASARLPEEAVHGGVPVFVGRDRVRVYTRGWEPGLAELEIHELEVGGRVRRTGGWRREGLFGFFWSLDPVEDLLLPGREKGRELALMDGATALPRIVLRRSEEPRWRSGLFLADHRVAVFETAPEARRVHVLSRAGEEVAVYPLPAEQDLRLSGEAAPGVLVLLGLRAKAGGRQTFALELETGRLYRSPELLSHRTARLDGFLLAAPPSPWFLTRDGTLVRLEGDRTWWAFLPPGAAPPTPVVEVTP